MLRSDVLRLPRRARHAVRLPPREILTTLRVLLIIVVVELVIRWVALPRLTRLLGVRIDMEPARPDVEQLPVEELSARAQRELRCTQRVADVWPFSSGPCLRRALVGGRLLRRLEPAVRIGLTGAGDTLAAHAWLEIDGRPLEPVAAFNRFHRPASEAGT
jgi:hypothetical protein